jgi:hypothetical protein
MVIRVLKDSAMSQTMEDLVKVARRGTKDMNVGTL